MDPSTITLISAIATPIALVAVAVINWRASVSARKASDSASNSAQLAAHTASFAAVKLDQVATVGQQIHTIVNSQNTKLLKMIAEMTARIAKDHPHDDGAQRAAADAASAVTDKLESDVEAHSPEK